MKTTKKILYKHISFLYSLIFIIFLSLISSVTGKEKQDGLTYMLAYPLAKKMLIKNETAKWLKENKYVNIPSISKMKKSTKEKILKKGWGDKLLSEIFVEVAKDLGMKEKNLGNYPLF